MGSVPQILPEKFILEVLDGPDKGAQFQVFGGDIKIGRGQENDIILNDPRCSRLHAILKMTDKTIYLEDQGSQHGIEVDGQKGTRAFISNGSKIKIGATTLIFKKVTNQSGLINTFEVSIPSVNSLPPAIQNILNDPKKLRFYGLIFGIVIFALFFLSNNMTNKTSTTKVLSLDEEIESSQKRQNELLKEEAMSGKNSRQYLDAQAAFTNGLRDYREGLYKSAMTSFNAALAIYPDHPTARRYLLLTQQKLSEQVQFMLQEGNRFMDQAKYQNAKSSYQQVMLLVGDPQSKTYQEAKEKYNECVLLLRDNF